MHQDLRGAARQSTSLGGRRACSCAPGGRRSAAGRTLTCELRPGHHPARREIQIESEAHRDKGENAPLWVFHNLPRQERSTNRLASGVAARCAMATRSGQSPLADRQLARGHRRRHRDAARAYPRVSLHLALPGLRRIAGEREREPPGGNGSADKNINDLLEQLHGNFHQLRQSGIDEELST